MSLDCGTSDGLESANREERLSSGFVPQCGNGCAAVWGVTVARASLSCDRSIGCSVLVTSELVALDYTVSCSTFDSCPDSGVASCDTSVVR
jgi:hypothetical protein